MVIHKFKDFLKKRRKLVYPTLGGEFSGRLKTNANQNAYIIKAAYYSDREKFALALLPGVLRNKAYLFVDWNLNKLTVESFSLLRKYHKTVKRQTGWGAVAQYKDLRSTCKLFHCAPEDYYLYKFYLNENKKKGFDYVYRLEMKRSVYLSLHKHVNYKKLPPVTNKLDFYKHAKQSNLPAIPVYYSIIDGKVTEYEQFENGDLFVKPKDGKGGRGITAWVFDTEEKKYTLNNSDVTAKNKQAVLDYYLKQGVNVIIQKRLYNHDFLTENGCVALSTCRIYTILNENSEPEVVWGVFRMTSKKGAIVDNAHRGGFFTSIELSEGVINKFVVLDESNTSSKNFIPPAIEGKKIPLWKEIKELAINAHDAFKPRVVIGWDICLTNDGPVLVEANARPCTDIVKVGSSPLTLNRFGDLLAHHLKK